MPPISIAELVPGSEQAAGDGITGARRCIVQLADGQRRAAVLKRGPVGQVAAEAFSALLLREWGLPVPEPFLVPEADTLAFASADAGYPSLKKRLGLDALPPGPLHDQAAFVAMTLATSLSSSGLAAAADEAIANPDRNLGNVLWDGSAEAWIDHAYSLGMGPPDVGTHNKLCLMSLHAGTHDTLKQSAVGQALTLDRAAPAQAAAALPGGMHGAELAQAVSARLTGLASLLLNRFPKPIDLLSGS